MKIKLSDSFTCARLLRFAVAPIFTMIFTSLYSVADGFFIARFVGATGLAAINFVFPILCILAVLGYLFGSGGSAIVARVLGEGDKEKASRLFSLFTYFSTLVGIITTLLGFLFLKPLLLLCGAEGGILDAALRYGRIILITLPFWNLQYLFQTFFVTAERPKYGFYITLLSGITNIVLDFLFIAVFGWDIIGAAAATALSQLVGGAAPVFYFASRRNASLLRLTSPERDVKSIVKAAANGSSELISSISGSFVSMLYNVSLIKLGGEAAMASYSVMMYVGMIFSAVIFGFANAVFPIYGYHHGAGNRDELGSLVRKSLGIYAVMGILAAAFCEIFALPVTKIFLAGEEAVLTQAVHGMRIYALNFVFTGIAVMGPSFFTALGNAGVSALMSTLRTVGFQCVCVLGLPLLWKLDGIWLSLTFSELFSAVMTVYFLLRYREKYGYKLSRRSKT